MLLTGGRKTVWGVVQKLLLCLRIIDTFLAVSEILGQLDVMEEAGEVELTAENGVWRYELE